MRTLIFIIIAAIIGRWHVIADPAVPIRSSMDMITDMPMSRNTNSTDFTPSVDANNRNTTNTSWRNLVPSFNNLTVPPAPFISTLPMANNNSPSFNVTSFFNDSNLMKDDKLDMQKIRGKLADNTGNVGPVNAMNVSFQLPPVYWSPNTANITSYNTSSTSNTSFVVNSIVKSQLPTTGPLNNGSSTVATNSTKNEPKHNIISTVVSENSTNMNRSTSNTTFNHNFMTQLTKNENNRTSTAVGNSTNSYHSTSNITSNFNTQSINAGERNDTSAILNNNTTSTTNLTRELIQMGLQNLTITPGNETIYNKTKADGSIHIQNSLWRSDLRTGDKDGPIDLLQNEFGRIIYSSVYFSNGELTPSRPYPKDSYSAVSWKAGLNELTNLGKIESYELGVWLAARYESLLNGGMYQSELVTIESGDTNYMFTSAECVAAGLFPPYGDQIWNIYLNWQPIPIQVLSADTDTIISMTKPCRKYDNALHETNNLPEWQDCYKRNAKTFDILTQDAGFTFAENTMYDNLQNVYDCFNELMTEENSRLPLPSWTKDVDPDAMYTLAMDYLRFATYTRLMQKYKAGPFIQDMVHKMNQKVESNSTEVLRLYSGSVYGLSAIMNSLGVFNMLLPPYASALLFELRKKNTDYIITVSLRNSTLGAPYLLNVGNCSPICTFDQFVDVTQDLIPTDWDEECNIISIANIEYSTPLLIAGLIVLIVLIFLFVLLLIKLCRCLAHKKGNITYDR